MTRPGWSEPPDQLLDWLAGFLPTDFEHEADPCTEPTAHLPGTAEKVEVLRRRARRREVLFHPEDPIFNDRLAWLCVVSRNGRPMFDKVIRRSADGDLVADSTGRPAAAG